MNAPEPLHATPATLQQVNRSRAVEQIVHGQEVMEGAGVRICRLLTQELQQRLDPWLMLDLFRSADPRDYIAGFPDHPHRGFETITYMLQGRMRHRDSAGHAGLLESGGVQWMTAGRGLIHSEMPEQQQGLMSGVQLWLNLPGRDKMHAPWYRDFQRDEIARLTTADQVELRVLAGTSMGLRGLVERPATQPLYLHVSLPAGSHFAQPLAPDMNAFVVLLDGSLTIGARTLQAGCLAILANDPDADGVLLTAHAHASSELLLLAGQPLQEPIVQRGPFVMNSEEEIRQAFRDYRLGRFEH